MIAQQPTAHSTDNSVHKPDWAALRLLNQYRLLILLALAAAFYLYDGQRTLGSSNSELFSTIHLAYVVATLGFIYLIRLQKPDSTTQFFLQNYLDILFIGGLMYSSGGINSGLGPLLLINLALLSQLSSVRHALLFAAIASSVILVEELLIKLFISNSSPNFDATALLGTLLFLTAWLMTVPIRHLMRRQLVKPTHSRVVLDVKQLAQLNEEIIREMDSGVIVVDSKGHVQLINDSARTLLAAEFVSIPIHLKKLCEELLLNLNESERSPTLETRPFDISKTGQAVLPHYTRLSTGGMLIRLDDHASIRQQFQQLKLASLGRLSASIAHEIRNPLGAISHAVQLMDESPSIDAKDSELLSIAKRHTRRINRIVEDVLQLSNRERVRQDVIAVDTVLEDFALRFRAEHSLSEQQLQVETESCLAIADPNHLDQVLWNLCTNAQLHNDSAPVDVILRCWKGAGNATVIDVVDNGRGISDMERLNLFDPFYSTHHAGTGLGLYIIHELCELNRAQIECIACPTGAHFRVTLLSAQDMAA